MLLCDYITLLLKKGSIMSKTIRISDEVYSQLKAMSQDFTDTPDKIISEILDPEWEGGCFDSDPFPYGPSSDGFISKELAPRTFSLLLKHSQHLAGENGDECYLQYTLDSCHELIYMAIMLLLHVIRRHGIKEGSEVELVDSMLDNLKEMLTSSIEDGALEELGDAINEEEDL
jgi:predicted DNA-binding antitoxin AbrB/MazE fold protein